MHSEEMFVNNFNHQIYDSDLIVKQRLCSIHVYFNDRFYLNIYRTIYKHWYFWVAYSVFGVLAAYMVSIEFRDLKFTVKTFKLIHIEFV